MRALIIMLALIIPSVVPADRPDDDYVAASNRLENDDFVARYNNPRFHNKTRAQMVSYATAVARDDECPITRQEIGHLVDRTVIYMSSYQPDWSWQKILAVAVLTHCYSAVKDEKIRT